MKNDYPSDWLCKCGHRKDQHGLSKFGNYDMACLKMKKGYEEGQVDSEGLIAYSDNCQNFKPIDNLTYIERIAKKRKLI